MLKALTTPFQIYSRSLTKTSIKMVATTAKEVTDFWFSPEVAPTKWYQKDLEFDKKIITEFSDLHQKAANGELDSWLDDPEGSLALVILLDQFSRNMFRGDAKSFAQDKLALDISKAMIEKGQAEKIAKERRSFVYLPFMHSENLEDQEKCIELFTELSKEYEKASNNVKYAHLHADIIRKFGRYPHRNEILSRETTAEEAEYLKEHGGF